MCVCVCVGVCVCEKAHAECRCHTNKDIQHLGSDSLFSLQNLTQGHISLYPNCRWYQSGAHIYMHTFIHTDANKNSILTLYWNDIHLNIISWVCLWSIRRFGGYVAANKASGHFSTCIELFLWLLKFYLPAWTTKTPDSCWFLILDCSLRMKHDDVIKEKHFPRFWPFVRGIHRSPVIYPHKVQWRGVLTFSLICAWINSWVNNREAGDLRRHRSHYYVILMIHRI